MPYVEAEDLTGLLSTTYVGHTMQSIKVNKNLARSSQHQELGDLKRPFNLGVVLPLHRRWTAGVPSSEPQVYPPFVGWKEKEESWRADGDYILARTWTTRMTQ